VPQVEVEVDLGTRTTDNQADRVEVAPQAAIIEHDTKAVMGFSIRDFRADLV
jgi:hypothetical protein